MLPVQRARSFQVRLPAEARALGQPGGRDKPLDASDVGKCLWAVLDRGTVQGETGQLAKRGPKKRLGEQEGQVSSGESKDGAVEVTRPAPEARVGTIVQLNTTRDPSTSGFLLQGRCGGGLKDY